MPGAERLRDSQPLTDLVAKQKAADKFHAAICATPAVAFEPQGEPQASSRGGWVGWWPECSHYNPPCGACRMACAGACLERVLTRTDA